MFSILFVLVFIPAVTSVAIFNFAGSRRAPAYNRN